MTNDSNVDRAIAGLVQRLVAAWNAHDPQAFAAAFANRKSVV